MPSESADAQLTTGSHLTNPSQAETSLHGKRISGPNLGAWQLSLGHLRRAQNTLH